MKLTIIVADFAAAYHMGADVERRAKSFEVTPEMRAFISSGIGDNRTVSFALDLEEKDSA